ncbi:MAG: sugar phosphate nucleotidyltransferase [Candidatus Saccharibacteria bacterium]|nr:sugar phosphate nucleotidyltransferase [Candidatus Saccharibacteria bacterium]
MRSEVKPNPYLAVIAGGKGTRLFPISTSEKPKPFCLLPNGRTFIQETVQRFYATGVKSSHVIVVVTDDHQRQLAKDQLLSMGVLSQNIISIPSFYGYAGAMVAATEFISKLNENAVIVNTPADQYIDDITHFKAAINVGIRTARNVGPTIVGVKVNDLDTFIGCGHASYDPKASGIFYRVTGFVEKPDKETANTLMRAGNTACNTGINIWKAKDLLNVVGTNELKQAHAELKTNELMKRFKEIYLHVGKFDWHDCGTLKAFYDICKDKTPNHYNVSLGGNVYRTDCRRSLFITIPNVDLYVTGARDSAVVVNVIDGELYFAAVKLSESQSVGILAEDYERNKGILGYRFAQNCSNYKLVHTNISDEIGYGFYCIDNITLAVVKRPDGKFTAIVEISDDARSNNRKAS